MKNLFRAAVHVLLGLTALTATFGLVSSVVLGVTIAGSALGVVVALTLLPLATWMGWRAAVSSPEFFRWLVRGTVLLAAASVLTALVGLSWSLLVSVSTGAAVADTAPHQTLVELGGSGICISSVLFGVIAAAVIWDEPPGPR